MQTPTAVAVDGVIPLGSLIRRYGCDVALNGNAVNITGAGYYDVDASVTVTPAAAGIVTISLYKDGVAVPGASRPARGAWVEIRCCGKYQGHAESRPARGAWVEIPQVGQTVGRAAVAPRKGRVG